MREMEQELENAYDIDGYGDDDMYDDYDADDDMVNNIME